jgi:hypothetical protein
MDLIPKLPSDPIPERIIPALLFSLSSAKERKNISIGNRNHLLWIGADAVLHLILSNFYLEELRRYDQVVL